MKERESNNICISYNLTLKKEKRKKKERKLTTHGMSELSTMKLNLPTTQLCEIKVRASNLQLGAHNKVTKMPTPELGWREKREKLRIIK